MRKSADILKEMDAIVASAEHENRAMTEAESADFDKLKAEYEEALEAQAAADTRAQAETAQRRQQLAEAHQVAQRNQRRATPAPAILRGGVSVRDPAGGAREFESFGEFIFATRFAQNDSRLVYQEFDPRVEQRMDDGASGGFLVPEQFASQIYSVSPQNAIVRPRATVIPAGDPPDAKITFPALDQRAAVGANNMFGGVTIRKVAGEGGQKQDTDAKFREFSLEPQEYAATITITDKLLRNWRASSAFLTNALRTAAVAYEDQEFLRGNGIGGPLGAYESGAAYVVSRENAGEFTFADYKEMTSRILPGGAPVWVISLGMRGQVMSLRNLEGSPAVGDGALLFVGGDITRGIPDTLGGYPIMWNQRSPAAGAEGDVALCDFSGYLIKDGSGPFVAASPHVYFTTNKTVIKMFANHDGKAWLTEPLSLEGGYEVSHFVLLGG